MKIYIAGPMRNYPHHNFDAFDKAADDIRYLGHTPISPTDMDRLFEGWEKYPPEGLEFSKADLLRFISRDLATIGHCDAVYLLRGWEKSKGARVEKALAEFLGLNLLYQLGAHRD